MTGPGGEEGFRVPDDLSGLLDGTEGLDVTQTPGGSGGSVWVTGEPGILDGSPYVCTVQVTDDVSIPLLREQAGRYAWHVIQAAHRAHYMAAVFAQMREVMTRNGAGRDMPDGESPQSLALLVLRQITDDLPDLDESDTAPLRFMPVLRKDGQPMVRVSLPPHDEPLTGWDFVEARQHALQVLDVAAVSDLDTVYRTVVARTFDAGEGTGRGAVADLANYYPTPPQDTDLDPRQRFVKPAPKVPGPPPGARPAGGKKRRRAR